jgi:hypothetical protein
MIVCHFIHQTGVPPAHHLFTFLENELRKALR